MTIAAALVLSTLPPYRRALADRVLNMLSSCRFGAAGFFQRDMSLINVQYEGQRDGGMHIVNGWVSLGHRTENFQCVFGSNSMDIIQFFAYGKPQPGVGGGSVSDRSRK
ncbi:MAG: hypothetical protein R3F53_19320 [Gammaproteobacteria bacterium]